jgi:hypothetical protein
MDYHQHTVHDAAELAQGKHADGHILSDERIVEPRPTTPSLREPRPTKPSPRELRPTESKPAGSGPVVSTHAASGPIGPISERFHHPGTLDIPPLAALTIPERFHHPACSTPLRSLPPPSQSASITPACSTPPRSLPPSSQTTSAGRAARRAAAKSGKPVGSYVVAYKDAREGQPRDLYVGRVCVLYMVKSNASSIDLSAACICSLIISK